MEADENFLRTASALMEGFPNSKQADEIGYLTGHFYRNRGRTAEAMHAYQQTVDRGKASKYADDAWWYLGWLQYAMREYDNAAQTWEKLLNAFPSSELAPDTLYWQGGRLNAPGDKARRAHAMIGYRPLTGNILWLPGNRSSGGPLRVGLGGKTTQWCCSGGECHPGDSRCLAYGRVEPSCQAWPGAVGYAFIRQRW